MKKIFVVLLASALGLAMAAHATDASPNVTAKQEQIKKLRVQTDNAHKKGDALTAKADKIESGADVKSGEKMRGCDYNNGPSCVVTAGGQRPSPDVVHAPQPNVNNGSRTRSK